MFLLHGYRYNYKNILSTNIPKWSIPDNAAYYAQGVVDGLVENLDNLEVQYTYHVHSGDTINGGGCYSTPNMVNVYCNTTVHDSSNGTETCDRCGKFYSGQVGFTITCNNVIGQTQDGYILGCGKSEETVESATIIY